MYTEMKMIFNVATELCIQNVPDDNHHTNNVFAYILFNM